MITDGGETGAGSGSAFVKPIDGDGGGGHLQNGSLAARRA